MPRFFREYPLTQVEKVQRDYVSAGYNVRVFPLRQGGLNQPNFRRLEFDPPGNFAKQLEAAKKLRALGYK